VKTVLIKRVSQHVNKDTKKQIFSSWGNEAYIVPIPKKRIDLVKAKK
jgi:hypothetical protein